METTVEIDAKAYELVRYPKTEDHSLRAWSNAELLILKHISDFKTTDIQTCNDRFGFFNCFLNDKKITTIWTYASQQKAIYNNLALNSLATDVVYKTPFDALEKASLVLLKIPKSLGLFTLFLQQIYKASDTQTIVVCGFMTKNFTASYLKIATTYFEDVSQTKAWKKARLLILKNPKKDSSLTKMTHQITWKSKEIQQYYGVFSATKIDIGTQFLLDTLQVKSTEVKVLDVASGNGIIACEVLEQNPKATLTLVDDFNVAIESSKLNVRAENTHFLCADNLDDLAKESFDLVVSNPPFHFEYENNIEVAISLFKGVANCLKTSGRFVLVANTHLNYTTHLQKLFKEVTILNQNKKFQIIECKK
ncbi:class I SAM-dependent methyltransferase [Tenacibaculum piscium]|uniref:class I SAM-dependent methyltransferase n=1 Tax=Tenacibaculum piscium TaxID=1458515 RepID=UPI001F28585E|nr:methyltransferase [Tenacibaculum piscium]